MNNNSHVGGSTNCELFFTTSKGLRIKVVLRAPRTYVPPMHCLFYTDLNQSWVDQTSFYKNFNSLYARIYLVLNFELCYQYF